MESNKGFSLVEMIIVVALIGIITTAIVTVFDVSIKSHTSQMIKAENQMNIRYAATYFRERVREADKVNLGRTTINDPYYLKLTDEFGVVTNYKLDISSHIIYKSIEPNKPKNQLFINIGEFTLHVNEDKSLLTITISSVADDRYKDATVAETIEIYIPVDKR